MADIDSLEIKIQSDATKASQSLDTLVKKLDSVAKSLGSINTSALSAGINELTEKLSAINGKGFNNLNKSAKEAETTIKKVSDTAKKGIKSKISFDTKDYQTVIDNLSKKFENAGKGFKTGNTLVQMQKQADALSTKLEKLLQKEDKIVSVGKMSPESTVFQNLQYDINATMNNLDLLYRKMGQLSQKTKDLSNIKINRWNENQGEETQAKKKTVKLTSPTGYNKEAVASVEAIYQKMYGDAEKAGQKTDSLGNKVEALKAKLKELRGQGLNFGDAKFDETYKKLNRASEELKKHKSNLEQAGNSGKSFSERMKTALANVNSQTNKTSGSMWKLASSVKNTFSKIFNLLIRTSSLSGILTGNVKKLSSSMSGFGGSANKATASLKSLTRQALSAMGIYLGIYGAIRGLKNAIKSSMDYVENLNYFNAAFGQVAEKADLKSFKKMGYESAEAYYNSFAQRAEQLTQKMSGFKIDESGMALSTGKKSMGIDPNLVMNYQAMFAQMTSSMGTTSEMSMKLSETLTKLGADLASVKNIGFKDVWENMASGITGMSRTLDKYGANIRNVNLQQELSNVGIDKSISKLNQQEKALLRTIVMLDSTRYAWGDMAKTIEQPANQLRLLQSNFSNLGRTIGNIFLPMVAKILPYLNAVTIMLQRFAEQIVKLLGFEGFDWGGLGGIGSSNLDLGSLPEDSEDVANNMDKTAKKAKKAVDNLQGFDVINKLQDPNANKDSDKDKEKGLSTAEMAKLTSALEKLMEDYNKIWDKAFKDMENKANELATKMQKALVDAWKKGDFSELGKSFAGWINKGLAKIPWANIKENIKKIARSIATFLNGFIKELDWSLVGKTFAEGLNTIILGGYEFWNTFDWLTFGESLAEGVNSFINNFDTKKFGKMLGSQLRGVIQFAFGFVKDLDFESIGQKIGNAINGFFEDMGKVRENTGLTGWQELGQMISGSVVGILDTINNALSTVKWTEVGKAIGQFIGSINWGEIFVKTGVAIVNSLWSAIKIAVSTLATDPFGIVSAITSIMVGWFTVKKFSSVAKALKITFSQMLQSSLLNATNALKTGGIKGLLSTKLGKIGAIAISLTIAVESIKWAGQKWKELFQRYSAKEISDALQELFKDALNSVPGKIGVWLLTGGMVGELADKIVEAITGKGFKERIAEGFASVTEAWGAILSGEVFNGDDLGDGFSEKTKEIQEALERTKSEAEKTKNEINEINKSAQETSGENIQDLADKYFELSKKTKPTASDIAVMKEYSKKLSDMIPGFSENIDKQTGAFKGSREQLNGMVRSLDRAARAQAAYNSSVSLYEKQREKKNEIQKKEEELMGREAAYTEVSKQLEQDEKKWGKNSEIYKHSAKTVENYKKRLEATREELNLLKKSEKEISDQIKKNNITMVNAKISTENYAKANKTLKDKMKELGVSSESQKEIVKKLNKAVDEGEISWKDYKEIVGANYTSVDELDGAIKRLSPKSVEVEATTSGAEDVSNLENTVSKIKDKNVTITANAVTTEAKYKINDLTTGRKVTITASLGNTKELTEKIRNALKSTSFKMTAAQIFPSKEQIAEYFKGITQSKVWKNAMNFVPAAGKKVVVNDKNKTVRIPKDADIGGLLSKPYAAMGYKINYYAIGGFPKEGQLFFANEAGPELVGNMNGRTTVAPQNDIAEGFAQAITNTLAPVMYAAFKQAATETVQTSGGDVYLDGMKLTESVIGHVNQLSQSRGRSPFWGVN